MREPLNQPNPKHRYVNNMFDRIAKRYDLMNTLMTAGLHRRWRRKAIELAAPPKGGLSLDVGCGTGEPAPATSSNWHRLLSPNGNYWATQNYQYEYIPSTITWHR